MKNLFLTLIVMLFTICLLSAEMVYSDSLLMAAKNGDSAAQNNLGIAYSDGIGVEIDNSEAFKWFKASADQGNPEALYNLGIMYYDGLGAELDIDEALACWELSAQQGNTSAMNALGDMYFDGVDVAEDYEQAIFWWLVAVEFDDYEAMGKIDVFLSEIGDFDGLGIEERVKQWMEKFTP
ncbi:MAG: tetratricopeptide repeat protein [Candidatus Cloacimonetes bacterium]|nr:tetratricopeptide repeat protein [Candidatus Cloacimonadota bacterium]